MLPEWVQRQLERIGVGDDLEAVRDRFIDALQQIGQLLAAQALNLGQNTLRFIASTGIMLYVLFFLFRDGRSDRPQHPRLDAADPGVQPGAARTLRRGGPCDGQGQHRHRGCQGTIGGVIFWMLGIQGALLWGVLMVILSLLPAVGAAVVWVPAAAIYLF